VLEIRLESFKVLEVGHLRTVNAQLDHGPSSDEDLSNSADPRNQYW